MPRLSMTIPPAPLRQFRPSSVNTRRTVLPDTTLSMFRAAFIPGAQGVPAQV